VRKKRSATLPASAKRQLETARTEHEREFAESAFTDAGRREEREGDPSYSSE
jgi:hypothetical protein